VRPRNPPKAFEWLGKTHFSVNRPHADRANIVMVRHIFCGAAARFTIRPTDFRWSGKFKPVAKQHLKKQAASKERGACKRRRERGS
jgi:hypothetical protein